MAFYRPHTFRKTGPQTVDRFRFRQIFNRFPRYTSAASDSYVYFARCGDLVKIGRSKTPTRRVAELQTANARPVTLLAALRETPDVNEVRLQFHFLHLRVDGEWFNVDHELAAVILDAEAQNAVEHAERKTPSFHSH